MTPTPQTIGVRRWREKQRAWRATGGERVAAERCRVIEIANEEIKAVMGAAGFALVERILRRVEKELA